MKAVIVSMALLLSWGGSPGNAAPRPKQATGIYHLDILGFNDGEPYRLVGAEAEAVLTEAGAVIYRFKSSDWMGKKTAGSFVNTSILTRRYANRPISDVIQVYRVDLDGDEQPEFLLVPNNEKVGDKRRYAPTVLKRKEGGFEAYWACKELPGERFKVHDLRDMNGDGSPEMLLGGEAGRRGYYRFHRLVGFGKTGSSSLSIRHVDSVHYVDLTRDGQVEIVVRSRVGRRGPAYQWTYVDQLYSWDGDSFADATKRYLRYHDEQTLPTLVDDLVDHFEADMAILTEKVEAIEKVRKTVLETAKKPRGFRRKMVKALKALQKKGFKRAKRLLEGLQQSYPYEPQVLMALATIHAKNERWERVLDASIRALTVDPRYREAWWRAAIAFTHLSERSSAVASLHNAVQLCGSVREGLSFLRARKGEKGLDPNLAGTIDETLSMFEKK